MKGKIKPIIILLIIEILGMLLIMFTRFIVAGILLMIIGVLLFFMWAILAIYLRISKKIDIETETQYFIGMFSGIFGGSIVLLADKLFYNKQQQWDLAGFILDIVVFLFMFLLTYVVGLILVHHHIKSLRKFKK